MPSYYSIGLWRTTVVLSNQGGNGTPVGWKERSGPKVCHFEILRLKRLHRENGCRLTLQVVQYVAGSRPGLLRKMVEFAMASGSSSEVELSQTARMEEIVYLLTLPWYLNARDISRHYELILGYLHYEQAISVLRSVIPRKCSFDLVDVKEIRNHNAISHKYVVQFVLMMKDD